MNIPTTKTLCDAERFCIGLKMLAEECNMNSVEYNGFGIQKFIFNDGSAVGGIRAFMESGIVDEQKYIRKYKYGE